MTPPVLSIAVDVSQVKKAISSSSFRSSQQIDDLIKRFNEIGVRIDRTSKSINDLATRMNNVARDDAFKKFAQDAKLSALEIARIRAGIGDLRGAFSTLWGAVKDSRLAIVAWGASLVVAGKSILDAQIAFQRLENSYKAVFGSGAASQLDMVYQQVDRVGLKFFDTANAAKSFFAAGQDTKLAPELENIFKALTDTGAALQLSTEEVNGAFVALGQMISKGKVQAEELRGQLGERLPGAFQMAAKAMGMTTAELDKFMADGKLTAEQLLPALAEALEEKYGRAAAEAANTAQGAINRMSNEWELFKKNVMDSGPMIDMINAVTDALASMNKIKNMQAERDRAVEFLKKEGIKPEGVKSDVQVLPDGTIIQPEVYLEQYSERQIKAAIEYEKSQNRVNAYLEQGQKEEAEAISKGRAAIDKALKKTAEYQITALRNERDILIADIDKSIEAYKAQGKDTSSLLADRDKVIQVYNQKIKDAGKKGAKSAKSAAVAQADYNGELERTRQAIDSLQQQLGLDKTEDLARAKIRIEQQYQATLSKTNEELTKQVAQGKLTQGQADTLKAEKDKAAELQKQVALRDAERKAQEKSVQLAEGQLKFFKELGELSGDYGQSLTLQNRLIEKQAKEYREVYKISDELVDKWVELQKLQVSQDPFDGAYRGLLKFSAEYADSGKQWESITYSFARDFNDATRDMFDTFLDTGRVSFASLEQSFYQLLKNMAYQALVQPVVLSIVGGVQQSVYGMTTAGRGGVGMGGLTSLPVSSLLPESFTSGISGITGTVLPGTHVAGLMGPTTSGAALSGGLTIGSALGYGAFGGLGYGLLGGALGLPQNSYTGVTSSLGGALGAWGGAALGSTGALAGSIIGSALPFVGTALGALAGGLIGGLFGGGDKDPGMSLNAIVDLGGGNVGLPSGWMEYGTTGNGYAVWSGTWEGVSDELNKPGSDALAQIIRQQMEGVSKISEAVGAIGNSSLKAAYDAAFAANRTFTIRRHWEDEEINLQEFLESVPGLFQEQMYKVLSAVDLSGMATAADGMIADTFDEVSEAITDAMSFVALGANLGEYQDDFNAAISGKLLDALNQMDTSSIALDIDKSSLAGWEAAAKALQGWQEVTDALDEILEPTSELESSLQAATTQFDAWIDRLEDLGWQESAIAEIEARRAQYMNEYASALTRATEQDLYLRSLALQYGDDSLEYGLQSLQYRQQNELAELAKKFGKDSAIYNQAVETQQAELLAYQIQYWQSYLQQEISSQQQVVDALDKLVDVLEDARADLWAGDKNLMGTRYDEALAQFDAAYQKAMSGDQEAIAQLPTLAGSLLALGKDNLATSQEYTDLFYDVDRKLKLAQEQAVKQVDAARAQLDALNAMLEQGDKQQLTLEEISAKLSELMERYQQELTDITGGGSLSQREALIQAKVNQLNAIAQGGRTDWTAESFLSYMYGEGLTLQSWYDKFGRYENLGVSYDSSAAYKAILENKADLMNAGLTLAPGQTAGGWTADKVRGAIYDAGMTVDEWYLRHGLQEGVGEYYKKYSQDAADSTNHTIKNMEQSLSGSLAGINSSINGLDWDVVVNVSGGSYGGNSTSNTTSSDTVSSNNTTVSGTVSGGWSDILREKAAALNRSETLAPGQTAGGWTADKVLEAIHNEGMTVSEWYKNFGKAEGFASGGITPANRPFWVGENGPELMMSPRQYGVLSNPASMALMDRPVMDSRSIITAIRDSGQSIYSVLRQLLTKTDAMYGQQRRILQRLDMWDAEGLPN